jgi:hypothetical protein
VPPCWTKAEPQITLTSHQTLATNSKNVNTKFIVLFLVVAGTVCAQTHDFPATNAAVLVKVEASLPPTAAQRAEQIRAECLQGRRIICGKILKVLPNGLVVDSGYTDLLRSPVNKSWLIPGRVAASRPASQVESREPESVCVGLVFVTDLPKSRGTRPKPYDYLNLLGYPTGEFTYNSVGTVQKTVRKFSANLLKAVEVNFKASDNPGAASAGGVK